MTKSGNSATQLDVVSFCCVLVVESFGNVNGPLWNMMKLINRDEMKSLWNQKEI